MSVLLVFLLGCNGKNADSAYPTCTEASACELPEEAVAGATVTCLDKGDPGVCLVTCSSDEDCRAHDEDDVCAPFESEGASYCFPPCGEEEACPEPFTCRSTGGGSENRKICFPQD